MGACARGDIDVDGDHLTAELRKPRATLGDEVEGEAVLAGRDRGAEFGVDGCLLARASGGREAALAVPDDRVPEVVEPVVGDLDSAPQRDRAGAFDRRLGAAERAGLWLGERPVSPGDNEGSLRQARLV